MGILMLPGTFAVAQTPSAISVKSISGHYYLQGATEMGSELLLTEDGNFQWMMSYGAIDQSASGQWRIKDEAVELDSSMKSGTPKFSLFKDDELKIAKPASKGTWVAIVGIPSEGPAPGIEVSFESKSGKHYFAVVDRNGDAITKFPLGEQWARAGFRKAGGGEWQWLSVPVERAKQGMTGFAIDSLSYTQTPAFKHMKLLVVKDGLSDANKENGIPGVYSKQNQ